MVLDRIENIENYYGMNAGVDRALDFVRTCAQTMDITQNYDLGNGVRAFCLSYQPVAPEYGSMEAHRQYIDVMFVKSGNEQIGYKPLSELKNVTQGYSAEQDVLLARETDAAILEFSQGSFAIWFPQDAHMPGISMDTEQVVERVMVKVPVG